MTKKQHGGQRKGAGPPRKMVEPVRITTTLEKSQLEQLKVQHGRNWQNVIRSLIATHLAILSNNVQVSTDKTIAQP